MLGKPEPDSRKHRNKSHVLDLRPGEIVEVRGTSEILDTLDKRGTLDGLPFIFEMREYCGRRFKVLRRINKIVVEEVDIRCMKNTVILEGVTCDGKAHGECARTCYLFWKEAWLTRTLSDDPLHYNVQTAATNDSVKSEDAVFSCQSTSLINATSPLPVWNIRRFMLDISSREFSPTERMLMLLVSLNLEVQRTLLSKKHLSFHQGRRFTPTVALNLQPGELVQVKTREEILATLDNRGRNRGLEFMPEMLKYCGRRFHVLKRFDKMIIERTGKMRRISNSVVLEGVLCDGKAAHGGCQRTCYCFWREIWLQRVS